MSEHGTTSRPTSPGEKDKPSTRVNLCDSELPNISAADWATHWRQQDVYVSALEQRLAQQEGRYSIHSNVEHFPVNLKIVAYTATMS